EEHQPSGRPLRGESDRRDGARARADAAAVSRLGSGGSVGGGVGGGGRNARPVRAGDQLSLHNSRSFGSSTGSSSTTVFHRISLSIAPMACTDETGCRTFLEL